MRPTTWHKAAGVLILGIVAVFLSVSPAVADDQQFLLELKARLDKLEKDNAELRQQLSGQAAPYKAPDPQKEVINKQVDDYLKEKNDKKKKDDKAAADKKEAEGYEVGKYLDVKGKWTNNQLWFETEDKAFRIHVGGRTQIDAVWVHAPKNVIGPVGGAVPGALTSTPGIGEYDDGVNMRRARLAVEGTFWEVFDFTCEYDFINTFRAVPTGNVLNGRTAAGAQVTPQNLNNLVGTVTDRQNIVNTPVPTDLWITWTKIPIIGNVRVGNQKQWIGFEHMTSSRYLDFMERSTAFDTFLENGNNGFVLGVSTFNTYADDRVFAGAGVYKPAFRDIYGWDVGDGEAQFVARVAATPVYQENGRCLIHAGVGFMHSTADDGVVRFRGRTQLRNGPALSHNVIDIIQLQGHDYSLIVPEFALNYGAFNLSAEYYAAFVNQRPGEVFQNVANQTANLPTGGRGSLFYHGGYVTAGYFLTGEHRNYNMKTKAWDRQAVNESAFFVDGEDGLCFGRGAVEVLGRYSWMDLDDKGVNGGVVNSFTAGVNWFLNPNAKIQFNYEIGYRNVTQYNGNAIAFTPGRPQTNGLSAYDGIYQGFGTRFAFDF